MILIIFLFHIYIFNAHIHPYMLFKMYIMGFKKPINGKFGIPTKLFLDIWIILF